MSVVLFLAIRVLHVVLAGLWLGGTFLLSAYVGPTIQQEGPSGGQIMAGLVRRGLVTYLAVVGGTTVVTGLYLYWRFTGGFDASVSTSPAGLLFGAGGIIGIVAAALGGAVVGRSAKSSVEIMDRAMSLPEGPDRSSLIREAGAARDRVVGAGRIVSVLILVAMVLMALGHYV